MSEQTKTKTLSIRLSPEHYRALEEIAELEKSTPGGVARDRIVASLHGDAAVREIKEKLDTLQRSIDDITHDLPVATQGLLLAATSRNRDHEELTAEQAAEWVKSNLRTVS